MIRSKIVKITDARLRIVRDGHEVFTSLEGENSGGSIKDHMVKGELENLFARGVLKTGDTISEISSGSTARSLAFFSKMLGLRCTLFVPFSLPKEKRDLLESLGAELHFVDPAKGYSDYADYLKATGTRSFNQFGDRNLARHYASLSAQVIHQIDRQIDFVIGSVGTGHSLIGVTDGFGRGLTPTSAEPTSAGAIPGIRNVKLEHFGENDPCDTSRLKRIEVKELLTIDNLETDGGTIEINDTFKIVLGALETLKADRTQTIFAIGAVSKRSAA